MIWVLCTALLAGSLYFAEAKPHRGTRSLNFLVVGDFGGQGTAPYYTTAEKKVASAMGEIATRIGSKFTIGLGDNIYPSGVRNVTDPRFQTTFEVGASIQGECAAHVLIICCRTCSRLGRCSRAGIWYAETMTTMATPLRRWSTQRSLKDGTCLICTTRR